MVFAETVVQIDAGSLITGLGTAATILAGGIAAGVRYLSGILNTQHIENRADRAELMKIVSQQWEQLSRLAQNTRVIAQQTTQTQKTLAAGQTPADTGSPP